MKDDRIVKSYVWHGEKCFFVSTIERDSSAPLDPSPRYNETIVWKYDWQTHDRGEMFGPFGSYKHDLVKHFRIVESLHRTGKVPIEES